LELVENSIELPSQQQAGTSPFKGRRAADPKIYGRGRITNHADLLPGVKGTSGAARRFRDLVNAYVDQFGGINRIAETKLGLVRQLACVTVLAEQTAAKMANGEKIDTNAMCTLASTVMRLSVRLGLERVDVKPEPGLHDVGGLLDRMRQERECAASNIIDADDGDAAA
jgi:hypothetical protein